jgi:hypothetical protein
VYLPVYRPHYYADSSCIGSHAPFLLHQQISLKTSFQSWHCHCILPTPSPRHVVVEDCNCMYMCKYFRPRMRVRQNVRLLHLLLHRWKLSPDNLKLQLLIELVWGMNYFLIILFLFHRCITMSTSQRLSCALVMLADDNNCSSICLLPNNHVTMNMKNNKTELWFKVSETCHFLFFIVL